MECTHHNQQEVLRQEEDVVVPKDSSGDAFSQEDGVLPESLSLAHQVVEVVPHLLQWVLLARGLCRISWAPCLQGSASLRDPLDWRSHSPGVLAD